MAVNMPWKELWEALKKDPLYQLDGFAERCIGELEPGSPAEYQYLDGIEGPQARLLHLLCDLGDLARVGNGGGKRDDAERLQYQVDPDLDFPYYSASLEWERPDDWDYSLHSAFVGKSIFMVDLEALKSFFRAIRLPLPHAYFPSESDTTDKIEKQYREKYGDRPIYLDDVRELMAQDCEAVEGPNVSPKMERLARKAWELKNAGKEQVEVHYEIYGPSSADPESKDRQVRKLLQIERELSVRKLK